MISLMCLSALSTNSRFETADSLIVAHTEIAIGSESVQRVVVLGKSASLMFKVHCVDNHVLFFARIGIIDKSSVIIVVLSWLHLGLLNESPEVLCLVLVCVLRKKSFSWLDVMSNWMFLTNCFCSSISI